MADAPAKEFSADTLALADKIVALTLKQAQELVDCLKEKHGIEPAGGGAVVMAGPAAGARAAVSKGTSARRHAPGAPSAPAAAFTQPTDVSSHLWHRLTPIAAAACVERRSTLSVQVSRGRRGTICST